MGSWTSMLSSRVPNPASRAAPVALDADGDPAGAHPSARTADSAATAMRVLTAQRYGGRTSAPRSARGPLPAFACHGSRGHGWLARHSPVLA